MKHLLLLLSIFVSFASHAEVNPAWGSFSYVQADLMKNVGGVLPLEIRRFYNSKSKHLGVFGFGWCSQWDDRIEQKDAEVTVIYCGEGRRETFTQQKDGRFATFNLKLQLQKRQKGYSYSDETGVSRFFDKNGNLVRLEFANHWIQLRRGPVDQIISVETSDREVFKVNTDRTGRVLAIQGPQFSAKYQYSQDLMVKSMVGPLLVNYQYSREKLLSRINSGKRDQIVQYLTNGMVDLVAHDGCKEKLNYKKSGQQMRTTVEMICRNKVVATREYISQFSKDGQTLLSQSQAAGQAKREVQLHPALKKPLKIAQGKFVREMKYDNRGRLIEMRHNKGSRQFGYDNKGRLVQYLSRYNGNSRMIKYQYDKAGNVAVIETDNGKFQVQRDPKGNSRVLVSNRIPDVRQLKRAPAQAELENLLEYQALLNPIKELDQLEKGVY